MLSFLQYGDFSQSDRGEVRRNQAGNGRAVLGVEIVSKRRGIGTVGSKHVPVAGNHQPGTELASQVIGATACFVTMYRVIWRKMKNAPAEAGP